LEKAHTCLGNGVGQRQEGDVVDDQVLVPLVVHDDLGGLHGEAARLETAPVLRPEQNRESLGPFFSNSKTVFFWGIFFNIPLEAVGRGQDEGGGDEGAAAVALVVDEDAHLPGVQTAAVALPVDDARLLLHGHTPSC
jgi:hypothetical protein